MIYVRCNNDGSLKKVLIDESINQGNNNVNKIFANVPNLADVTSCKATFKLPDQSHIIIDCSSDTIDEEEGFSCYLPNTVTLYHGFIYFDLEITYNNGTLYTTQLALKVNPTNYEHTPESDDE
jgi:hypothetical protein